MINSTIETKVTVDYSKVNSWIRQFSAESRGGIII